MQCLDTIPVCRQGLSRLRVSKDCFAPFLSQEGLTKSHKQKTLASEQDCAFRASCASATLRARFAILSVITVILRTLKHGRLGTNTNHLKPTYCKSIYASCNL